MRFPTTCRSKTKSQGKCKMYHKLKLLDNNNNEFLEGNM